MSANADGRTRLRIGGRELTVADLGAVADEQQLARLPYTLRILLENTLRAELTGRGETGETQAVLSWSAASEPTDEVSFRPARVLLQDFTGVPAVVDLAVMRDAMRTLGGDPQLINPLIPAELVIDHSVQVDEFGTQLALRRNTELEFERNRERYAFLRWGQQAFQNFKVVPPNTGIVHQVNLEYLARVVEARELDGEPWAFPDTLVGTDSHTTMVNGLGVLGWGVGGIEAEAVLLGEPMSMLLPQVVGFTLTGSLPEGATATDLVLTVTEILRKLGVVGKFVEFVGDGLASLPLADRSTIANMAPEYGATCGFFPVDAETLRYLRLTGRSSEQVELVEAYCRAQSLFHDPGGRPEYSQIVELDLGSVEPSLAGPRRPQDRVPLHAAKRSFLEALSSFGVEYPDGGQDEQGLESFPASDPPSLVAPGPHETEEIEPVVTDGSPLPNPEDPGHGAVVIAAITSCTNTSNPSVMIGAGLLAKKAVERGLTRKPWVKSSLAPGSRVVTEYYERSGLLSYLEQLGFNLVGYGCTTCIGNSGPLSEEISRKIEERGLVVCAVLSGNRNFEARIHPEVKANYLASPPLVVAYALAGRMDIDLLEEPLGHDREGEPVYLRDLWPSPAEIDETIQETIGEEMFRRSYEDVFAGDEQWRALPAPTGELFEWDESSTYVRRPPTFDGISRSPALVEDLHAARCLVVLGDSVTTDHISPAGSIQPDSPAGRYLVEHGVERRAFNSYGSRRGNHEVMVRGTFANVRLRNLLIPGIEGTWTVHLPSGEQMTIFDAAERYRAESVPLIVIAGKEYGSGSSRDWAAKGPCLLGVRAVVAESYERIHRSNLVGMGILPLQFQHGQSMASLELSGRELYAVEGVENGTAREVTVTALREEGEATRFTATLRLDTPREREYLRHGGILPYALRQLIGA